MPKRKLTAEEEAAYAELAKAAARLHEAQIRADEFRARIASVRKKIAAVEEIRKLIEPLPVEAKAQLCWLITELPNLVIDATDEKEGPKKDLALTYGKIIMACAELGLAQVFGEEGESHA